MGKNKEQSAWCTEAGRLRYGVGKGVFTDDCHGQNSRSHQKRYTHGRARPLGEGNSHGLVFLLPFDREGRQPLLCIKYFAASHPPQGENREDSLRQTIKPRRRRTNHLFLMRHGGALGVGIPVWIHAGMQQGIRPDLARHHSLGPSSPPVSLPLLIASQGDGFCSEYPPGYATGQGVWPLSLPVAIVSSKLTGLTGIACPSSCHRSPPSPRLRGLQMSCIWKSEHRTCLSRQEWARNLGEEARPGFPEAWEEERALLGKTSAPRA